MLSELNAAGLDKVEVAIKRLQMFQPEEGYYLAFSGGKDSVCVKALADMAEVKYDAHYTVTTVDPPELVYFVKTFEDVSRDITHYRNGDPVSMWNLIPRNKVPPTRLMRYCCRYFKERGNKRRFKVTGVRHAESTGRAKKRSGLELADRMKDKRDGYNPDEFIDPDNPDQGMIHVCQTKAQRILNPIIDWSDEDVWEFIRRYDLKYCSLYDEGFKRLGCIGCPMADKGRKKQFERWSKYKNLYLISFDKMLFERKKNNMETTWKDAEEVMDWWLSQ